MRNSVSNKQFWAADNPKTKPVKNPKQQVRMALNTRQGRLYLNATERQAFEHSAHQQSAQTRALCLVLLYTGCRVSEALSLELKDICVAEGVISIRSLKKRGIEHFRSVPVPQEMLELLPLEDKLFSCSRTSAWRAVKACMRQAGISGPQATPKGLRHSFGTTAIMKGVPITLVQRWLGHADIRTTAIYANITGPEERLMARRMWQGLPRATNSAD